MFTDIRAALIEQSRSIPDRIFLISEPNDRSYTYKEFCDSAWRIANLLKRLGVNKGDKVSLLLQNSTEYIIAYFACFAMGAVAGPVNSHLKSDEIEYVLNNSEAVALITESQYWPHVAEIRSELKFLRAVIIADSEIEGCHSWQTALNDEPADPINVDIAADDDAFIIYTSGTTGKPKGVMLSHRNLLSNAEQITTWLGIDDKDRMMCIMPLFHVNAVMVTMISPFTVGGSMVVMPKFSASRHWDIVSKYRVTSFGSVATMLALLNQRYPDRLPEELDLSCVRFALCGSAPVPVPVMDEFEKKFGVLVVEGYGLSECACRATFNPPNENRRPGSIGVPIGSEVKIFDDQDNELPVGETGEIVLRGPNIMKGYFKNDQANAKTMRNGWLHTGDVGYRDAEGFFYLVDRKNDMIIRAGENIYPREIDEILYNHPAVQDAATIGVPDNLYGEQVCSYVVIKAGNDVSDQELIDYCQAHLADYKCPKSVVFLEEIPKGPTGKLLKRELRELAQSNKSVV
jgi:long-chain acyl-CoA synthetase